MARSNGGTTISDMEKYVPSTTVDAYIFDRLLTKKLQDDDGDVREDALLYLNKLMLYSNKNSRKLELCGMAWHGIAKDIPVWNDLIREVPDAKLFEAKRKKSLLEFRLGILTHYLWMDDLTVNNLDVFLAPTSSEQMENILQGCYTTGLAEDGLIASDALLFAILLARKDPDKVKELVNTWRVNSPNERIAKWGDGALHIANKYIGLKTDRK